MRWHFTLMTGFVVSGCITDGKGLDPRYRVEPDRPSLSFGAVDISLTSPNRTLNLVNTGLNSVILEEISVSAMGVELPFAYQPVDSSCQLGLELAPEDSCSLVFSFSPRQEYDYVDAIQFRWKGKKPNGDLTKIYMNNAFLGGKGNLNCQLREDWQDSLSTGESNAIEDNETAFQQGLVTGQSLTYDDGYSDGFSQSYSDSYWQAYTPAYNQSYGEGYFYGFDQGYYNLADRDGACQQGESAGNNDGTASGNLSGSSAGYQDGYNHGVADGEYDALYYLQAVASSWNQDENLYYQCVAAEDYIFNNLVPPRPNDEFAYVNDLCVEKGYSNVFNPNSFSEGWSQGASENEDYQQGIVAGNAHGSSQGEVEGRADGQFQGYQDGEADGLVEGTELAEQEAYDDCYEQSYSDANAIAHAASYDIYYDDGYIEGYDEMYYETLYDFYYDNFCYSIIDDWLTNGN